MAHRGLTDAAGNGDEAPDACAATFDLKESSWARAKAVLSNVQLSQAFTTLRDMSSDAFIEPTCLKSIKVLGEGAYAVVHQAWYTPQGSSHRTMVAVKYLKQELFSNTDDLQLFVQEVELMNKLRHRNIVGFIGAGEVSDSPLGAYVVQEYMAGGTVKQLVTRQMLSNGGRVYNDMDALDICLQIARGLKYLHNSNPMVIHRDLKLENVLIKGAKSHGKYEVKLADFGLSKRVDVKQAAIKTRLQASEAKRRLADKMPAINELEAAWTQRIRSQTSLVRLPSGTTRTRSKELLDSLTQLQEAQKYNLTGRTGSVMYMAPEVFNQLPYNEKADVFSFGVMMYEIMQQYIMLLAVSVKGTYEELEDYCARVAGGYRPPLLEKWPPEISSVIADCWAHDPAARPSMNDVVARLEEIQASGVLQQHQSAQCRCCIS